mgnify:CR=1 FL=1
MAKGKLSEDTIRFILEADSSKAQQEIHKTNKSIESLEGQKKKLLEQQAAMSRAHLTESKEYKDLTREIKLNQQSIDSEKLKLQELHKKLGINSMTMAQLRKEAKNLQYQLDNTSKALQPQAYKQYSDKLTEVRQRMAELKGTAMQVKEGFGGGGFIKSLFGADINFSNLKTMLSSSGIIAAATYIADQVVQIAQSAFQKVKWFYDFNIEVEEARRLTKEFLGATGDDLTHLQSQISAIATQTGKEYKDVLAAVDTLVNHFGITTNEALTAVKDGIQAGADLNGSFLSQIQQFAPAFRDAGASVSDLVALITQTRSGIFNEQGMTLIQTATNRIRTMSSATQSALDGIGISSRQLETELISGKTSIIQAIQKIATRISELPPNAMQVGEVMKSVFGKTSSNEGMKMIETIATISTNMNELKEVTGEYGELERKQIDTKAELNEKFSEMFGIGKGGFEELTARASIFIIKIINYCQSLYKEIGLVRGVVEAVKIAFDTLFKFTEWGFRGIISLVKFLSAYLKGMANMVEGVFTFDFKQVEQGWKQVSNGFLKSVKEFADNTKDLGTRWGKNFVNGVKNVIGGTELPAFNIPQNTFIGGTIAGSNTDRYKNTGNLGIHDKKKKEKKKKKKEI